MINTDRDNKIRIKKFLGRRNITISDMAKQIMYSPSHVRNGLNERKLSAELLAAIEEWMKNIEAGE